MKYIIILMGIITTIIFILCFEASSQHQNEFEQKAKEFEHQLKNTKNIDNLIKVYRDAMPILNEANKEASSITGMQHISIMPSETPEKEAERRREIINIQFNQAKNMLSELSEEEENPQISQAQPLEGYIIVKGGERELWYNNQLKTDISYAIKESFVGNLLIIHTYNPVKGQFEAKKDYELDTISTKIELQGLIGKKCSQWSSGSPSVCTRWADLSNYKIDPGEKYPQFYSNVVFASSHEEDRVKIEAKTPNIVFYSSDGTSAKVGCSGAEWSITKQEFETLLKSGQLVLKKVIGEQKGSTQHCRSGSTMELYLKLQKEKEPQVCKNVEPLHLEIVKPEDKSRYVFNDEYLLDESSNSLVLELEAKVSPDRYADSVEWIIPELGGSKKFITPLSLSSNPRGRKVTVKYKGLPESYKDFGKKTVIARLKVDSCTIEDKREIQLFYPRDAKNNPEGKYPNWFYYWKQTPAARPFGQMVNIVFGGTEYDLCKGEHVMAIYKPDYLFKSIHVCDLTKKIGGPFEITIPLVSRDNPATLRAKHYITYTHIDTFAVLVMHEFTHFNHYHTWWSGKTRDAIAREDVDGDGVPDRLEVEMGFNPGIFQTYWGDDEEFKNINGDEEFLAYESTYNYPIGKYDEYDWGKPGKNWY